MGKKSDKLEYLIKEKFSKLSFYSQNDTLEIKPEEENKNVYNVEYNAIKASESGYNPSYFKCNMILNFEERAAVWKNVWLDDDCRGKGWGGELIRAGELLFKKLDMQTAYIDTNSNQPFWTSRGYKASLKVLNKEGKKNFYQHVYETITSMIFYKGEDVTINPNDRRKFEISYSSGEWSYDDPYYENYISIEMRIDFKKKKAVWGKIQAPHKSLKERIVKFDKLFHKLGIK